MCGGWCRLKAGVGKKFATSNANVARVSLVNGLWGVGVVFERSLDQGYITH